MVNQGRGDELPTSQGKDSRTDVLVNTVVVSAHPLTETAKTAEPGASLMVEDLAAENETIPAALTLVAQIDCELLGVMREEAHFGAGMGAAQPSNRGDPNNGDERHGHDAHDEDGLSHVTLLANA
jgi:hypothetical protein